MSVQPDFAVSGPEPIYAAATNTQSPPNLECFLAYVEMTNSFTKMSLDDPPFDPMIEEVSSDTGVAADPRLSELLDNLLASA